MNLPLQRAALLRAEWQGRPEFSLEHYKEIGTCVVCAGVRPTHEPDCILKQAIDDLSSCEECNGTGVIERSIANGQNYSQDAELVCECRTARTG